MQTALPGPMHSVHSCVTQLSRNSKDHGGLDTEGYERKLQENALREASVLGVTTETGDIDHAMKVLLGTA